MRRRRRLLSALVARRRPLYHGVLPELGHGCEGERLCSCTSIGGYFGTTVAQSLKNGGEIMSSNRGSMSINYIKGKAKKFEKARFSVRGCFDLVTRTREGRLI